MQEYYTDDSDETLSLSNLCMEDEDDTVSSEQLSKPNQTSSSSSSSSSLSDGDFSGFFSEEWSRNTSHSNSPENIIFCGKVVSSRLPISEDRTKSQTTLTPLFRSNSDSFRFMSLKPASRPSNTRSKSLPNRSASLQRKSRFLVFIFGSGSAKFPTKIDLNDIKSRQVRRQSSIKSSVWVDGGKEESCDRRSGKKGWWRLVDVLGCGGGYKSDTVGVI